MVESAVTTAPPQSTARARRVSPAAHLAERFAAAAVSGARAVRLHEVGFLTMVGLRAVPGSAAVARLETALGTPLPSACGSVTAGDGGSVLWLSPDEFLVVSDEEQAPLTARLLGALGDAPGSVVDLSANRTTFELAGASARATLEKGCPLDLHPRAFEIGTAYVTSIGSVPVLLWRVGEELYRILPRSSYADFLGRWLVDAMAEFKAPEFT
ncbi:sarcosine oxidase subunit gamma [Microlunatus lacustris]